MKPSTPMVTITFHIQAKRGKEQELLQAIEALHQIMQREEGCLLTTLSRPKTDTNRIIVSEMWANAKDALHHFRSKYFRVMHGAIVVLAESSKMSIAAELQTTSIDLKNLALRQDANIYIEKTLSEM